MRPNQQNKNRSRGRNNNGGRKHVNPLNRSFESNGPDVKVRGNAAHIAEKYLQLARDAQSSGDGVMAENYLQHAEHYFRIVAAAQPQSQRQDQTGPSDSEDYDDDFPPINDRFASPEPRQPFPPQQQQGQQNQQQGQQTQQSQGEQQPEAGGDSAGESQPAEAAGAGEQGDGNEPRRHRERRARRRPRGAAGESEQGETGAAPQPEVGELPAFLTAGGTPTAAE